MEFKSYRKITPTVARVLTELDYDARGGTIQTNEGPDTFLPGDYLARDAKGEWPIPVAKIRAHYQRLGVIDDVGFAKYQPLDVRLAVKMIHPFEAGGLYGKAGDYLVKSGESEWPVDSELFELAYESVIEQFTGKQEEE